MWTGPPLVPWTRSSPAQLHPSVQMSSPLPWPTLPAKSQDLLASAPSFSATPVQASQLSVLMGPLPLESPWHTRRHPDTPAAVEHRSSLPISELRRSARIVVSACSLRAVAAVGSAAGAAVVGGAVDAARTTAVVALVTFAEVDTMWKAKQPPRPQLACRLFAAALCG